jgi:hypothetical protein
MSRYQCVGKKYRETVDTPCCVCLMYSQHYSGTTDPWPVRVVNGEKEDRTVQKKGDCRLQ